jgi:WD40 repeat protein
LEQIGQGLKLSEPEIRGVLNELDASPKSFFPISSTDPDKQENFGTGFIIHQEDASTYILTCARVIDDVGGMNSLRVNGNIEASLIANQNEIGLTVLKIRTGALRLNAEPLTLCASGEEEKSFVAQGFYQGPRGFYQKEIRGKLNSLHRVNIPEVAIQINEWELEVDSENELHAGYIGSPILDEIDEKTKYALGIINHVASLDGRNSAISIKALREVWPGMPHNLIKSSWVGSKELKQGHANRVTAVIFHPSNNQILFSSGDDSIVRGRKTVPVSYVKKWNYNSSQFPYQLKGHESEVRAIALTEDGRTLVSGSKDGTIRIWDVTTGEATGEEKASRKKAHSAPINAIAFCSENTFITGSDFRTDGTLNKVIKVWRVEDLIGKPGTSKPICVLPEGMIQRDVRSLAFNRCKKFFVCGSNDGFIRIISLEDIELSNSLKVMYQVEHKDKVYSLAISRDGRTLVSGSAVRENSGIDGSTINIWSVDTDSLAIKLDTRLPGHGQAVRSVAISLDGQTLASGGSDGYVRIWDLQNLKLLFTSKGTYTDIRSVAFSQDGQLLASGSSDAYISIWKVSRD